MTGISSGAARFNQFFVRDLASSRDDQLIVTAIIGIAPNLQIHVVAEGVETQDQLDYLKTPGCDAFQENYSSKPVVAAAFTAMLEDRKHLQAKSGAARNAGFRSGAWRMNEGYSRKMRSQPADCVLRDQMATRDVERLQ